MPEPEPRRHPRRSWTGRRPTPATAGRLLSGLLLLSIGLTGGVGLGLSLSAAPIAGAATGGRADPADALADALPEAFDRYLEALRIVRRHYVDESALTDENLVQGSIRGMVEALGDSGHTVYLTPEQLEAEQRALDGALTGIGVTVDTRTGAPVIVSVIAGSPADRAGLRAGDLISAVDGARTDHISLDDIVDRVRGEEGTPVVLRVRHRDGSSSDVTLVRERIAVDTVTWGFAPGSRVAVIGLLQFSGGASEEVAQAARAALEADASAIVLDLRGNPGGLVTEAIGVASLFLDDAVVYRQRERDGDEREIRTVGSPVVPDLPMAVLVDGGSASASEIVASALGDNGRARIVGAQTFGTGTVLNLFPLSDGSAIRLGVQSWLTPSGESAFSLGITPDVAVELRGDAGPLSAGELEGMSIRRFDRSGDRQLRRAVRLLRRDR